MLNMIAAAIAAAQPAAATAPAADAHAQHRQMDHQQMGHQSGGKSPGMMADIKDCCCKDKMAKMHGDQSAPKGDQHQNHKQ